MAQFVKLTPGIDMASVRHEPFPWVSLPQSGNLLMYQSFFGLTEKPFSLLPDPGFFYLSKIHQEALTLVEYGLYSQSGFTVLTGEIGSGKTTLMRYLLEKLDEHLTVGLISNTHHSLGQIMDWVCAAFDLKATPGNKIEQHQLFVDFLLQQYASGKKTLLIIDEAQNLGLDKLEEIRLLSNINADKDLVLQLLLLGQPQLRDQLRRPELEQFVQRVSASYHLGRLSAEETFYYIRHRMSVAGGRKDIFTPDASHAIYHFSKGIPRVINLLCETALVYAYGAGERTITGRSIETFVRSDASHLLLPIDPNDPAPVPTDKIPVSALETVSSTMTAAQDSGASAAPDQGDPSPQDTAEVRHADPAVEAMESAPSLSSCLQTPDQPPPQPQRLDAQATGTRRQDQVSRLAADLDSALPPAGSEEEVVKPSGDRTRPRRWSQEFAAVAVGLCMGFALILWYGLGGTPEPETPASDRTSPADETALQPSQGLPQTPAPVDATAPSKPPEAEQGPGSAETAKTPAPAEVDNTPPPAAAPGALSQTVPAASQDSPVTVPAAATGPSANEPVSAGDTQTATTAAPVVPAPAASEGHAESAPTAAQEPVQPPAASAASEASPALDTAPEPAPPGLAPTTAAHDAPAAAPAAQPPQENTEKQPDAIGQIEARLTDLTVSGQRVASNRLRLEFARLIQFSDRNTQLGASSKTLLTKLSEMLRDSPNLDILVVAHTDSDGGNQINQALSERRAKAVADFIVSQGVATERVTHLGKGEDDLKATPEEERTIGPWVNRRIEIDLIGN